MSVVANRYGEALLQLAEQENQIKAYQDQLKKISEVFDESILIFFDAPGISKQEKKDVLKSTFFYLDHRLLNFLYLLVDKKRMVILSDIQRAYHRLANEALNIVEGVIYSVRKLEASEIKKIEDSFSKKLEKEVILENKVDPSLIGGIKVEMDQRIFDGTLKNEVEQLKDFLLKQEGSLNV